MFLERHVHLLEKAREHLLSCRQAAGDNMTPDAWPSISRARFMHPGDERREGYRRICSTISSRKFCVEMMDDKIGAWVEVKRYNRRLHLVSSALERISRPE